MAKNNKINKILYVGGSGYQPSIAYLNILYKIDGRVPDVGNWIHKRKISQW